MASTIWRQDAMEVDDTHPHGKCTPWEAFQELTELDLCCNLRVFGSQMGLESSILNDIESESQHDSKRRLLRILEKSNDRELLTWPKLVNTLMQPSLEERKVAKRLCERPLLQRLKLDSMLSSSERDSVSSMRSSRSTSLGESMSLEDEELDVPEIVNELARMDIDDWTSLAESLGLRKGQIKKIEKYHENEQHQRLAEMLDKQDIKVTKLKLQQQYSRRESDASMASLNPLSPTIGIGAQVDEFESKFMNLQCEVQRELEILHRGKCVEVLRCLSCLPRAIAMDHQTIIKRVIQKKDKFVNLESFFHHLNLHCWNFFEYKVLESIIKSKCSAELKGKMADYAKEIDTFKRQTTISKFISCAHERHLMTKRNKQSVPPRFKKITLEHAVDPDTFTLADLDEFRTKTLEAFTTRLSECAMHVFMVKHGSIIVKWMVLETYARSIVELFHSPTGQQLLRQFEVVRIKFNKTEATIQSLLLLTAAKNGRVNEVESLLNDPKTNINYQQHFGGWTALHLAATEGHVEIAEMLLKKGCDIHLLAGEGWTPLQRVCLYKERYVARRGEMVTLLLDHDAMLNIEDRSGRNPLFAASTSGFVDIVKILLERIAKLPKRIQKRLINNEMMNGWFPIMDAAKYGHAEVIKLLLEAGATAIKTKEDDETALHIAAYHGHVDVVKVLTASRDRLLINARDKYGLTPLMMAVDRGHNEVADVLLEAGADVNLQSNDKERRTALMFAAKNGVFSIVNLLLKHKPDVNIKDSRNKTAYDLASTSEVRHCLTEKPVTKPETEIGVST